jgi:2-amino-4-hydroxy-6-hydroxymethyldihydropteridine diphosphokinase
MTHTVFLALGSNLGDRLKNLRAAIALLSPVVQPVACSPVYETPPWGFEDQPKFLNQVLQAHTQFLPEELLDHLKGIEKTLGRQETFRYGPRTVDLDIIFYDDLVFVSERLQIPHPRLANRAFVLLPLAQLAPEIIHPIEGLTVREMLASTITEGITLFSPGGCGNLQQDDPEIP